MKTAFRIDRAPIRAPKRTPQGFLEVDGAIARPGIYEYPQPDGTVWRELTPHELAFDAAVLGAYDALSVTNGHPRRADGTPEAVTAANVRSYEVGTVRGAARRDGERVACTLVVKDAQTIRDVEAGRRELSPGYSVRIDERAGADRRYGYPSNPEGRYDAIRTEIVPNHLAIVDVARGGRDLRLRMDGQTSARIDGDGRLTTVALGHQHLVSLCDWTGAPQSSGTTTWAMSEGSTESHEHPWVRHLDGRIEIGESAGHTHTVVEDAMLPPRSDAQIDRSAVRRESGRMADDKTPADAAEQLRLLTVRADEAEKLAVQRADALNTATGEAAVLRGKLTTAEERIASLEAQIKAGTAVVESAAVDEQRRRADEAERQLVEYRRGEPDRIKQRCSIITRAQAVLGFSARLDGLTNREIVVQAIQRMRPKEPVGNDRDERELVGRFDALVEDRMTYEASLTRASQTLAAPLRTDATTAQQKPTPRPWGDQWKDGAGQFATTRAKEA